MIWEAAFNHLIRTWCTLWNILSVCRYGSQNWFMSDPFADRKCEIWPEVDPFLVHKQLSVARYTPSAYICGCWPELANPKNFILKFNSHLTHLTEPDLWACTCPFIIVDGDGSKMVGPIYCRQKHWKSCIHKCRNLAVLNQMFVGKIPISILVVAVTDGLMEADWLLQVEISTHC